MRANRKLAHLWLDALATELSAAAGTLETYTDDLNCYLTWLEGQNLGLQGVTLERVRDYITDLDQRGYAGSTVARRITVVRGLHRFLIAEDLGSNIPPPLCRPCAGRGNSRSFSRSTRPKLSWRRLTHSPRMLRWGSTARVLSR
jgi:site-specific recombinase XerD